MEDCVIFWNISTGDKQAKTVRNLVAITACKDLCLLAVKMDEESLQVCISLMVVHHALSWPSPLQCTLLLCDALGTPVDSRNINMGNYLTVAPENVC